MKISIQLHPALSRFIAGAVLLGIAACATPAPERVLHWDDFSGDLRHWVVEQMPGGTVVVRDGALEIAGPKGCTVWFREKLTAPIVITYEATVIAQGGPHDRVSDLNCFWMASDSRAPDGCPFGPGFGRTGKFEDYDSLRLYYVGMGGNQNKTTRFRRYVGDGTKPLATEHDLSDKKFLLEANHPYRIKLVAHHGTVEYWRDGERLFAFTDAEPLQAGWFGFRLTQNHVVIRNFRVERPTPLP